MSAPTDDSHISTDRYLPASTLQRFGALLVDAMVFSIFVLLPALLISWWFGPAEFTTCTFRGSSESCTITPEALRFTRTTAYILCVIWLLAYARTVSTGSTFGKRATESLVVDASTGDHISYPRALARTVLAVLGVVCGGVGLLVTLTNRQRRSLHDMAMGTRVISP